MLDNKLQHFIDNNIVEMKISGWNLGHLGMYLANPSAIGRM